MVSEVSSLEVNSVCVCGAGDKNATQKNTFENICPNCGRNGTLQIIGRNVDVTDESTGETTTTQASIVSCKECGAEYCGQDGYDLYGGTRGRLGTISPDGVSSDNDKVSEEEEEDETYMSGWEGLCDLLRPLDAEAMIIQRGDYVIVKKIEMPQTARLWAYEGFNVVDDSVSITDYTPEIYNTFIIKWGESYENELEFVFENHKKLFGERKCVLEAKKVQEATDSESNSESEDSGSIFDMIFGWGSDDKDKKNDNNTDKIPSDLSDVSGGVSSSGSNGDDSSNTEEVPITTREEAIQFGKKQVGKAKREDGHTIELKVIGNLNWQVGEWCHVKLPSFNEDCYMFISKCSFESSPDSEYINSLTLVDYPPSLGKPLGSSKEESSEEESSEENTDENSDSNNADGTNNADGGSSNPSSSNTNN